MKTNYNLSQQLKNVMKKSNITIAALADQSGISEDTIKAIRTGRIKSPGIDILVKLADVFECSIDELIGRDSIQFEEKQLIMRYRALSSHSQNVVLNIIRMERCIQNSWTINERNCRIPCITPTESCTDGFNYDTIHLDFIEVLVREGQNAAFAYRIGEHDYQLAPSYFPNDILLFENRFPRNNEIGLFVHESYAYVRRFCEESDQTLELRPLEDSTGQSFSMKLLDQFKCLGTFVGLSRET